VAGRTDVHSDPVPATPTTHRTFATYLDTRSPGLDVVRVLLAIAVLVSHTWPLGGFGTEPGSPIAPGFLTLGGFAVAGFFALSGLLVGRSALTRTPAQFTRARLARIVPGYWVALAVSGFALAGLGYIHDHGGLSGFLSLDPDGPVLYVLRAALFPIDFHHGVYDVFTTSTPFGRSSGSSFVNGSLWTLPYEIRCYLVVGIVGAAAKAMGARRTVTASWAAAFVVGVLYERSRGGMSFVLGPLADPQLVTFVFVFLSGMLVAVWADRIRLWGPLPAVALVLALLAGRHSLFAAEYVAAGALALVLPPLASLLGGVGAQLRGVDLSYGLYLYAWPIQQLVAMYGLAHRPATFIACSLALTTAAAALSWYGVERPAMRRWGRR